MTGIGLHSGKPVWMRLCPAPSRSGVSFRYREAGRTREVPATFEAVADGRNATTLAREGARVRTVEHLLAAIAMHGVDDVVVDLDADEPPGVDGSAAPFVALLERAGLREQPDARHVAEVLETVALRDGERAISIEPSPAFGVDYEIDFEAPAIGRQRISLPGLDGESFRREVAGARTFGFLGDVDRLRAAGLARGASLANTVVVDGARILNEEGLRHPDEFVRHKVLDLVGDLSLFAAPLRGHVRVSRGGHALHHALLRALHDRPDAWRLVEAV